MAEDKNKKDDFFSLIEKEQKIENPFAEDEILFRDEAGNLKVLKGGEVQEGDVLAVDQKSVPAPITPAAAKVSKPAEVEAVTPSVVVKVKEPAQALPAETLIKTTKSLNLDQEIENIIKKSEISFSDGETKKRFENIVRSRLKGMRDQVQVREMLLGASLIGGMGFDITTADKILGFISQVSEQLDNKLRDELSSEPFADLQAEANQLLKNPLPEPPSIVFKSKSAIDPISDTEVKSTPSSQAIKPAPIEALAKTETDTVTPPAPRQPATISRPVASPDSTKPKIEDVRFEPRLTGPIEEIRSMTLTDFRRLASTPTEAIEKIIEKIEILEEESFTKKTQAIRAWKENEVQRLYLNLGDQSMEQKKSISEIITERQAANQPTLTEEELEAVIDLNKSLRY